MEKKNIIFDTQYFVNIRFRFEHKELQSIEKLVERGYIRVLLTDITIREITKKMMEQVKITIQKFNSRDLNILSVIPEFVALQKKYNEETAIALYEKQFFEFRNRCKVKVISCKTVDLLQVFDDYCNVKPPFSSKQDKKAEFPDAFALAAIANWAKKEKKIVYLLSADRDWKDFSDNKKHEQSSPAFSCLDRVKDFTSLIYKERELVELLSFSDSLFDKHLPEISINIVKVLQNCGYASYSGSEEVEITDVFVLSVDIISKDVLSSDKEAAIYSLECEVNAMFEYEVTSYEYAIWDSEDQVYRGEEYFKVLRKQKFPTTVEIEFSYTNGDTDSFSLDGFNVEDNFEIRYEDEDAIDLSYAEWKQYLPVHVFGVLDGKVTKDGSGEMYFKNINHAKALFPLLDDDSRFKEGKCENYGHMLVYYAK